MLKSYLLSFKNLLGFACIFSTLNQVQSGETPNPTPTPSQQSTSHPTFWLDAPKDFENLGRLFQDLKEKQKFDRIASFIKDRPQKKPNSLPIPTDVETTYHFQYFMMVAEYAMWTIKEGSPQDVLNCFKLIRSEARYYLEMCEKHLGKGNSDVQAQLLLQIRDVLDYDLCALGYCAKDVTRHCLGTFHPFKDFFYERKEILEKSISNLTNLMEIKGNQSYKVKLYVLPNQQSFTEDLELSFETRIITNNLELCSVLIDLTDIKEDPEENMKKVEDILDLSKDKVDDPVWLKEYYEDCKESFTLTKQRYNLNQSYNTRKITPKSYFSQCKILTKRFWGKKRFDQHGLCPRQLFDLFHYQVTTKGANPSQVIDTLLKLEKAFAPKTLMETYRSINQLVDEKNQFYGVIALALVHFTVDDKLQEALERAKILEVLYKELQDKLPDEIEYIVASIENLSGNPDRLHDWIENECQTIVRNSEQKSRKTGRKVKRGVERKRQGQRALQRNFLEQKKKVSKPKESVSQGSVSQGSVSQEETSVVYQQRPSPSSSEKLKNHREAEERRRLEKEKGEMSHKESHEGKGKSSQDEPQGEGINTLTSLPINNVSITEDGKIDSPYKNRLLSELCSITGVPQKVSDAIENGTFKFTRKELIRFLKTMGCTISDSKHTKAKLPDFSKLPDFLDVSAQDGTLLMILMNNLENFGEGSLTLPRWEKDYVPQYLQKQIRAAHENLKNRVILTKTLKPESVHNQLR
jgi:hypothetical protein